MDDIRPDADRTLSIQAAPIPHPCPCRGSRTLADAERGRFDICPVCDGEDDSVQHDDPDCRGGANARSLKPSSPPTRTFARRAMPDPTTRAGAPAPLHAHPFEAA